MSDLIMAMKKQEFWFHPNQPCIRRVPCSAARGMHSSYITGLEGEITQHLEYMPFGESLVEEHQNSINTPYKFNGKELDDETGNYYYGARYYDPKISIWLSVDPLAEHFASWSSYSYVFNNPLNFTDSTGMCPDGKCPDPVNMKANEDGSFDDGELDPVVMTIQQSSKGKAKAAQNKMKKNYNAADWAIRQGAMKKGGSLAHLYRTSEKNGIYPNPSKYKEHYEGTGAAYADGWTSWDKDGLANSLMNFSAIGIGGSLAATVAAPMIADGLSGITFRGAASLGRPSLSRLGQREVLGYSDKISGSIWRTGRGGYNPNLIKVLEKTSNYSLPGASNLAKYSGNMIKRWAIGGGLSGLGLYHGYKKSKEK